MFKIQENADGSTSVYHKKTGQHMCTIPVKPNSSSPLRINVVEPQPSCNATVVVKDWRLSNFKTKVPDDSSTEESSSEDDLKSNCRSSSPEAASDTSDPPADDPKTALVRALNLLPTGDLGGRDRWQWPLRLVSQVDPVWPRLVTDLTPLSCRVGEQLLREEPKQNLLQKEAQLVAAVRKYEGFCVASGLPPSEPGHARLRCRRPAYPVCTSSKTMVRAESTHVYTFGARQRRERLLVIETGLDCRSRRLLAQCRDCQVRLERISKEEIKRWRRRTTQRPPPARAALMPVSVDRRQPVGRTLTVRLPDVTRSIIRSSRSGGYYLAGTGIHVLNYAEFLATRRSKPPPRICTDKQIPLIDLTQDSPPKSSCRRAPLENLPQVLVKNSVPRQLHKASQLHAPRKRLTELHLGNAAPHRQPHGALPRQRSIRTPQQAGGNSVSRRGRLHAYRQAACSSRPAHGPVLRAMLLERQLPTHFRCFACGCNRYISGNAEIEVLEHMRRFHSVMDPDRFLTVYRDQVKRCTIVEAFPGYKGSND